MSRGEESAQISIALAVLSEQEDLVMVIRDMCTCRGIEPLAISEGKSGDTEGGCPFNEFFWVARALQKGAAAFDPQGYVGGASTQHKPYN
jgi:hypothetical protein